MIYVILAGIYSYIIIKIIHSYSSKSLNANRWISPPLNLMEFLVIAVVIAYLFHHYYFQQSDFEYFIIPSQLIWITFISCLFLFGIGIGFKYTFGLMNNFVPDNQQIIFAENKKIYEIFSQIWINVSILMIFFSYSLMEISKPTEKITSNVNIIVVYTLSAVLGVIMSVIYQNIHRTVQKVTVMSMIVISICLILFVYESRSDFLTTFPVTISFIIFNLTFFLSLLTATIFTKKKVNREYISLPEQIYNNTHTPPKISITKNSTAINFPYEREIKLSPSQSINVYELQKVLIQKSKEKRSEKPDIRIKIPENTDIISLRSLRIH